MGGGAQVTVKTLHKNKALVEKRLPTLAVAESCTGGLLGALITARPGASRYFLGGVTAYSDRVKEKVLKVPPALLKSEGAVSAAVAAFMAKRVRALLGAEIGLAVTGIAGPDGGTPEKPVGLVYIAAADSGGVEVEKNIWRGGREAIRRKAARTALALMEKRLERKS